MGKEDETEAGKSLLSMDRFCQQYPCFTRWCFRVSSAVGDVEPIHKAVEISHKGLKLN